MSTATAWVLATVLHENFEEFADMYADAIANGGGLENVIAELQEIGKVAQ